MSTNVHFIRLGPTWLIPATSEFCTNVLGQVVVTTPAGTKTPIGGALLRAYEAFLNDTVQFPVTAGGILDLWKGWTETEGARDTMALLPEMGEGSDVPTTPAPLEATGTFPLEGSTKLVPFEQLAKRVSGRYR